MGALVKIEDVRKNAFAMPLTSPAFPPGPYRFINREYLIITYRTDPAALERLVPEPLKVAAPHVKYEFIRMPDSSGFGDYTESGQVIPVTFQGKPGGFVHSMFLDDEAPIAGGREIWGFPKKNGNPKLDIVHDTLTGTLEYAGVQVAVGTMSYKQHHLLYDLAGRKACSSPALLEKLGKTQVNLKIIPHVDGSLAIAQLVAYNLTDIQVKGGWSGPARLHLVPHINAPVADLPVRKVLGGLHFIADLTLPYGRVLHDYLAR